MSFWPLQAESGAIVRAMGSRVDTLARLLPAGVLTTDLEIMAGYRRDSADIVPAGQPAALVRARTADDVSRTLAWASEHAVPVVPRGIAGRLGRHARCHHGGHPPTAPGAALPAGDIRGVLPVAARSR